MRHARNIFHRFTEKPRFFIWNFFFPACYFQNRICVRAFLLEFESPKSQHHPDHQIFAVSWHMKLMAKIGWSAWCWLFWDSNSNTNFACPFARLIITVWKSLHVGEKILYHKIKIFPYEVSVKDIRANVVQERRCFSQP